MSLRVTEIFYSLQGETRTVGLPTVFVRLTGCPLRCDYCDTSYAFQGGAVMTLSEILEKVQSFAAKYVTVTGGEPLAQKNCWPLLSSLCDLGYEVSLETSGAFDVSEIDPRVVIVMDIKTPGSKEAARNKLENIQYLKQKDQIKFIICNREDYEWSKTLLINHQLPEVCELLFSPAHGQLNNQELADWIIADNLPVRFQLQLHKYIWGDKPGC